MEGYCGNLFDWGSHVLDLLLYFTDDVAPESVFGQIDVEERRHIYGALTETASVTHLHWADGVNATVFTGRGPGHLARFGDNGIVLHGSAGRILIAGGVACVQPFAAPERRIESAVDPRFQVAMGGVDPAIIQGTAEAVADLVHALSEGRRPVLDSRRGLAAAELAFATYESSARRGSVRLPLEATDNALLRGLELGFWEPHGESFGTD
jgi:predicted dehydrogenase